MKGTGEKLREKYKCIICKKVCENILNLKKTFSVIFIITLFCSVFVSYNNEYSAYGVQENNEGDSGDNSFEKKVTPREAEKVVRVGYYYKEYYQEGMSDNEEKKGYCYEYLQKIANYNGWRYEYVYGEWENLYEKLVNGDIDILAGVAKNDEREKEVLFPIFSMGEENYYLYQHQDNGNMSVTDYTTINGKTIGVVNDGTIENLLDNWKKGTNTNFYIEYYESVQERNQAFEDKKLDGIAERESSVYGLDGVSSVARLGEKTYYIAVAKSKPELVEQLNRSFSLIQEIEPYYLGSLRLNGFGFANYNEKLSEEENEWVKRHKILKVGCLDNYMPFSGNCKNGDVNGVVKDVFTAMVGKLNLEDRIQLEYKCYDNTSRMIEALNAGEVDAIFPISGESWEMEQNGIYSTATVITTGMNLVYKGKYSSSKLKDIAFDINNKILYNYVKTYYPETKIIECSSVEEALDKVLAGKASCTIINALRSDLVQTNDKYSGLSMLQLENSNSRYIGVRAGNNALLLLLNRGINLIGQDYAINSSYNYMGNLYSRTSLQELKRFIADNIIVIMIIVMIILAIIIVFVIKYMIKAKERSWFKNQAYTDGLTKLNNRLAYEEKVNNLTADDINEDFVYASVDINGLKYANDTFGHAAGDELIIATAEILDKVFSKYGSVYRMGGDEYALLLNVERKNVEALCRELTEKVESWQGKIMKELHLSVGYARKCDYPSADITMLSKLADAEMYAQKEAYYKKNGRKKR